MGSDPSQRRTLRLRKDHAMKRFQLAAAMFVSAIVSTPTFASDDSRCVNASGSVEQRACAMAAAGPDALRRFVQRTAGIYGLYYGDFASADR
jgi:hypothetical protein